MTVDYLPEDGVSCIEVAVVGYVNEELCACCVCAACVGHRDGHVKIAVAISALKVRDGWLGGFAFSALNHEACNDSLEDGVVVVSFVDQFYKVGGCDGFVVSHLDNYVAF